jgi:hypothetical protein
VVRKSAPNASVELWSWARESIPLEKGETDSGVPVRERIVNGQRAITSPAVDTRHDAISPTNNNPSDNDGERGKA